jgi:hypothetical protein
MLDTLGAHGSCTWTMSSDVSVSSCSIVRETSIGSVARDRVPSGWPSASPTATTSTVPAVGVTPLRTARRPSPTRAAERDVGDRVGHQLRGMMPHARREL